MFRITRTAGVTALLAVCTLMPWTSDALAEERPRHQLVEHRHRAGPQPELVLSPTIPLPARHIHLNLARQLARERDQLLEGARRALSRGRLERAGWLFWRAVRVERQLHQAGHIRRHDAGGPHRERRQRHRDRPARRHPH